LGFGYQVQFLSATTYILLSTTAGNAPISEIVLGMTVGVMTQNWIQVVNCSACVYADSYSNFVDMPD